MSSVSFFDKIGVVAARPVTGTAIVGLSGVDSRATFGLLQSFTFDSKVLAQIKRTLRRVPVIFPMGDDLTEISMGFLAPLQAPCPDVTKSDLAAAVSAYKKHHVTPDNVKQISVAVGNTRYSCLLLGMRAEGSMHGTAQIVSVSLRLVGVGVA
jgi:hypothetical protein